MSAGFRYEALPVFEAFERVSDPSVYVPLPDSWFVGVADVVNSTEALRGGRYKAVNMAGAAVVAAARNALGTLSFPFVFGGDGATLAVPPEAFAKVAAAMAATVNYVEQDLGLSLRTGLLSVATIRAAGHDMRVARYAASPEAVFAMFSGGGASYAEEELKAGRIAIAPAAKGERPDLSGLSCRWSPIRSRQGIIVSLLVAPAPGVSNEAFRRVAGQVIELTQAGERNGHPVPDNGPNFAIVPSAIRTEAQAPGPGPQSVWSRFVRIVGEMGLAMTLDKLGRSLGRFDPRRYRRWVARNSDFRKYDDALRMTIDCSPAAANALEGLLGEAERAGVVNYGMHRQDAALMTCIVPSFIQNDHIHFLDGAGGGYALAARSLKEKAAARRLEGQSAASD